MQLMSSVFSDKTFEILKNAICQGSIKWSIVYELTEKFDRVFGFKISRFENRGDRTPFEKGIAYLNVEEVDYEKFKRLFEVLSLSDMGPPSYF